MGRRGDEILEQVEALKPKLQPIEQVRLAAVLKPLMDARDTALRAWVTALLDEADEPLADVVHQKENYARDSFLVPFARKLDGLSNVTPDLAVWSEVQSVYEGKFFQGLAAGNLGDIRDEMLKLDKKLKDMIATLDRKWSTMSEEDQRLEKIEQDASAAMSAIVQKALSDGTTAFSQMSNLTQRMLDPMMKLPDLVNDAIVYLAIEAGVPESVAPYIPKISLVGKDTFQTAKDLGIPAGDVAQALPFLMRDPGMAASETVQKAIGPAMEALVTAIGYFHKYVLPGLVAEYARQLSVFKQALPNQGTVLVTLSQTRADVDAFLKESGMEKLQALYERAVRALDDLANAAATDGLKHNAATIREVVKAMFDRRFQNTTHAFEEFVRANQGRFVGTISRETENALLWTDIWVDRVKGIANLGMDARLKEWRSTTITITDQFDNATQQVRRQLIGLPIGVAEPICDRLDQAFAKLREQLKSAADTTAAAMDDTAKTVAPEQITRDLDRSQLRARLYA